MGLLGIALLLIGLVGAALSGLALAGRHLDRVAPDGGWRDGPGGDRFNRPGPFSDEFDGGRERRTLGESIFLDGIGQDGREVPRSGPGMMMGRIGCADCHGADGRGRRVRMMMGTLRSPDIRYDALTSEHEDGEAAWRDEDIRQAVTEGVEPNGDELSRLMPRWNLSDEEFDALLEHLRELSQE